MEQSLAMTDILYYVPEDGERLNTNMTSDPVQTHLNVFTIPNKSIDQVNYNDIV